MKTAKAAEAELKLNKEVRTGKSKKLSIDNIELLIMSLPVIIYLFIFAYTPMSWIILAFKDYSYDLGVFGSKWVGFKNFKFFFTSQDAWKVTRNTVGLNLMFIFTGLFFSVFFAIILFEIKKKYFIKIYQTIMILPNFLSWVVVGFMTYALFNHNYGIFNKILEVFGKNPVEWYFEAGRWPFILTSVNLWKGVGMSCIMYYAALVGIDREYFEAAAIDGASKWQTIRNITLPFLIPLMTILTILSIGGIFRSDFGLFFQITRNMGQLYPTTDVIDTYVFRALRQYSDIGMSTAVGLYQSIVGFIMIIITNTIAKKIDPDLALY